MATDDDLVFRALADPTRRHLLDRLFERDGRTLTELESELEMTRFGVMKHLRLLEGAGLVVTRREGRQKLHYLNPVPIRLVADRWIGKFAEPLVGAMSAMRPRPAIRARPSAFFGVAFMDSPFVECVRRYEHSIRVPSSAGRDLPPTRRRFDLLLE